MNKDWKRVLIFASVLACVSVLLAAGFVSDTNMSPLAAAEKEGNDDEIYVATDQAALNRLVRSGEPGIAFVTAFEAGDELTEFSFASEHGVGANVGDGRRFARFPRADLAGAGEWAAHQPSRDGGPNATSCIACHNAPIANGAGDVAVNAVVDPAHTGDPKKYLERNTLPLFGLGAPQRLAEEMSLELQAQKHEVMRRACMIGEAEVELIAKGVSFGSLAAVRTSTTDCAVTFDVSKLEGIDEDLVVRAFGWKGNRSSIRAFTRGAAHNELGMQAVELVGDRDGDHDGVKNELTVGDLTALSVYMAGLERPVTRLELAKLGLADVSSEEKLRIGRGERLFVETGCSGCHVSRMRLNDPVFREPSVTDGFYDVAFPSGAKPIEFALDRDLGIAFDLRVSQPNNRIALADGEIHHLGGFPATEDGGALVNWYTDFKRHDMGPELADPVASDGIAAELWLTRSLAGVGSTGPWLHDGRATTLDEAIRMHGGEGSESRAGFAALPVQDRQAIVAFLENLVIFKQEEKQ